MMPGEAPPPATAAGIAAEAATACANCGALQQNLNEYVAALIALKEKIMDMDRLLTDYEQKCNELKCTERENNAFRQQVEQMLQKLSPLERCKEELGSVKAELEEKKSSLKMYQETHLEYVSVKEEMGKSEAMKKKLEAKVKKLEKATEKHNQDFKQLKAEKKVLEKELKKAQEKIESFPRENKKKVVKHVETQSEREWPITDIDKEKIKLLLEELWLCIDSSTGKSHINKNDSYLAGFHNNSRSRAKTKAVQDPPKPKRAREERPSHCSSPETCTTQTSLTSLQIKVDSRPAQHVGQMASEAMETPETCIDSGTASQGQSPEFPVCMAPPASRLDLFSKELEETGEDLTEILKWVRPLPRLLSPIQFSPATIPDMLFGELTDSSDEEIDRSAQKFENISENHDQSAPEAYAVSGKNPVEPLRSDSSSVNNESSDPCELSGRPAVLKDKKSGLCSDSSENSGLLNRVGVISKDGEKKNCGFMEKNPEIAFQSTKNVAKSTADVTETEKKPLVCDLMFFNCLQKQEKTVEPRQMVTSSFEQALNESGDIIKKKEELKGTVEVSVSSLIADDQPLVHKGGNPQETEAPVFATENALEVPDKDGPSRVIRASVANEGSEDIQAESDLGRAGPLTEHRAFEQNRTEELCARHNGEPEFPDRGMNLGNIELYAETDHHIDQVQHKQTEAALMLATENDVYGSGVSVKLHWEEGNCSNKKGCHKGSEYDINEKAELDSVDALRSKLNVTQAVDGWENSLCCSNEVVQTRNECSIAPSSQNEEGDKLKIEVENIVRKDKTAGSILAETPSLVITKSCLHPEDHTEKKDSSQSLQEESGNMNVPVLPTQVSVVKDCLSQPEEPVQTNQAAPELESVTRNASELGSFEEPDGKLECMPEVRNMLNSIQSVGVITEDKSLTSERLEKYGSEPLATAVGCEKGTSLGVVQSWLVSENSPNDAPSREMTKQNESISPKPRSSSVEMNECCATNETILEVNSAQSMQAANADCKAVSLVAASSEPSVALFLDRNGPGYGVAANGQSYDPSFIAPSTSADRTDHCDDREHLMVREADADRSDESQQKSLDSCSHNDQDEGEMKRAGKQSASSETQALVHVKGYCDVKNSTELFEAPNPNGASAAHTSAENQGILSSDKGLIITSNEKMGSHSKNCTLEAVLEETDKILSIEVSSREADEAKTQDGAITVLDVSASISSEEEYPLRKVNPTKKNSGLLAFRKELDTAWNSQADVPYNMVVTSDIRELMHLAEDASPKDEQAHSDDSCAEEAAVETVEHSYAAPCSSGKGSSALKASVSDEKEASKSIALTNRAEVDNKEPASRRLSASDPEVNGGILSLEAEPSGTNAEPSAEGSTCVKQEKTSTALGRSSKMAQDHLTSPYLDGSTNASFKKESHAEKDGEILAATTSENSIQIDSRNHSTEKQEVVSQKSELLVKSPKQNGAEQVHKPSDLISISAKAGAADDCGRLLPKIPSFAGRRTSHPGSLAETVVANTDTSTSMQHFPKTLRKIRQEMGPPLPPLLPPLIATPPRTVQAVSPMTSASSQFSLPSPLNKPIPPLCETPLPSVISPLSEKASQTCAALHTSPSPSEVSIGERTLSSPLQFCAATPKHALPVPGRFPPPPAAGAAQAVPQENSVEMLDSLYPKLSARAITLNILRGNIQLSRPSSLEGRNVHQISGYKEISSSSTAFVKTGTTLFSDLSSSSVSETGKRMLASPAMPRSAKRLRLDSESLNSDPIKEELPVRDSESGAQGPADETACLSKGDAVLSVGDSRFLLPAEEIDPDNRAVTVALEKMSESCFDLFPVIRSRVHVGSALSIPVMTDEEKEVVYDFGIAKKYLAEPILHAILKKLKHQRTSLGPCHIHSLCRVYVGICRQLRDLEKARLFCYSLLKEDFPQSGKLILFMGNMWSEVFTSEGVLNKAIQLVARNRARGQVLKCLKAVLNWEEHESVDIGMMISSLLMAIKLCAQMEFQASEQHGEDLKENMWEYVFAIDLLCSYQKWVWTHDHIISKELWPIMDKWIKSRKGSGNTSSPSDVIVATVLRLIGRLSQIGLKEGFSPAVKNISSVIGAFLRYAKEKDVPWGVQLAAVYALCELGPSGPSEILDAISAWEAVNGNSLPPAITSRITEVSGLLEQ
ncbi:little elongation complex subunit 1 [Heteronotia binoei]|uniref:little elongation complex subunit 1 n=1 Tax=Heteronotia binoei TaxID=13085 RepID=UPI00292EC1F5|nr:little elongation complex subunit 1 [Heteronotia binoei]